MKIWTSKATNMDLLLSITLAFTHGHTSINAQCFCNRKFPFVFYLQLLNILIVIYLLDTLLGSVNINIYNLQSLIQRAFSVERKNTNNHSLFTSWVSDHVTVIGGHATTQHQHCLELLCCMMPCHLATGGAGIFTATSVRSQMFSVVVTKGWGTVAVPIKI